MPCISSTACTKILYAVSCRGFSTRFFKLRSAARAQYFTQHICLRKSKEGAHQLYIGPAFAAAEFWAEPAHALLGGSTLAMRNPDTIGQVPLYLSTCGDNERVDLWSARDSKQTWLAAPGKKAGEWHFSVQGGNAKDHARVKLSCGLGDSDQEGVELWHAHTWSLHPAIPSCNQTQGNFHCASHILAR